MMKHKFFTYIKAIVTALLAFGAVIVITMVLLAEPLSLRSPGIVSDSIAVTGVFLAILLSVFAFNKLT